MGRAETQYEIIEGSKAFVEATLKGYETSTDPHSLIILGYDKEGSTYSVLVRYRDKNPDLPDT